MTNKQTIHSTADFQKRIQELQFDVKEREERLKDCREKIISLKKGNIVLQEAMAEKERLFGGGNKTNIENEDQNQKQKKESEVIIELKSQNCELTYKIKDLEQQITYLESKHKDYEDTIAYKDSQLAEQDNVIQKNIEVIQSQQKDNEELHDELDILVNKVTQLTEDNQHFYEKDKTKSLQIKNLKESLKIYEKQ